MDFSNLNQRLFTLLVTEECLGALKRKDKNTATRLIARTLKETNHLVFPITDTSFKLKVNFYITENDLDGHKVVILICELADNASFSIVTCSNEELFYKNEIILGESFVVEQRLDFSKEQD